MHQSFARPFSRIVRFFSQYSFEQTAGYSGKPLFQKLGMKPGLSVRVLSPPAQYSDLIAGAEGITFKDDGVADIVHLFCRTRAELDAEVPAVLDMVADRGMLWFPWPKKSSKLFYDLTEDQLREIILPAGWVDVKVCAVDAAWSGLKFLRRRIV